MTMTIDSNMAFVFIVLIVLFVIVLYFQIPTSCV